jgi:hypothetical protein
VLHIGQHKFKDGPEGRHLIWIAPDAQEHDLGPAAHQDLFLECPGFHRGRTHALGQKEVQASDVIDSPVCGKSFTVVKLKDGTQGIGPNYKMALRNAALKRTLQSQFTRASGKSLWDRLSGRA